MPLLVQKYFIFTITLLLSLSCHGSEKLAMIIDSKINDTDPSINIGIKITNLDKGKIIYQKNTDRYYNFASAMKFITVTSLIEHFGTEYIFSSKIAKHGNDYYLDINDPDFSTGNLSKLIGGLKKKGISKIDGNFIIAKNNFSLPPVMRTKLISDNLYCYGAPITKVHINKNCSRLIVTPKKVGKKIEVKAKELVPYDIVNTAITSPDNSLDRLYTSIDKQEYIISGTLNNNTGRVTIGAVVNDNFAHVKYMLQKILQKNNINLSGKILYGKLPKNAKIINSHDKTFKDIAAIALKKSDNFITDYLLAEYANKPKQNQWRHAAKLFKNMVLAKFSVDLSKSEINDGSGISRYNLITINQFDSFLKATTKKPYFPKLLTLMAAPGEDTTLRERFSKGTKLYAKTGKLRGVSTLVGYFYNKDNELHSFVIAVNNIYGGNLKYCKLQDDIINTVINY